MAGRQDIVREAALDKSRAEVGRLEQLGCVMAGNAFSPVLFVKGTPNEAERNGAAPLSGADGDALRAALTALGYAPQDWCAILTAAADGTPLAAETLRLAVATLDPATLLACDEQAAQALREAFASELVEIEDLDRALLAAGVLVGILGMRVMNLGGFEASLADAHEKQVMWARLKRVPPMGAPY